MVSGLFCFLRSSAAPSEGLKVVNGRVILGLDYSDAFELHILRTPFRNPGLVFHALRRVNDMNYFKAFQPVAAAGAIVMAGQVPEVSKTVKVAFGAAIQSDDSSDFQGAVISLSDGIIDSDSETKPVF